MKRPAIFAPLILGITLVAGTSLRAEDEDKVQKRTFHQCILYKGGDGNVWIGQPLVSLGMIGVRGNPPQYRLSPPLAERFAPLVNEVKDTPKGPRFWWWGLPLPKDPDKPMVLVRIDAKAELRRPEGQPRIDPDGSDFQPGVSAIYEVTAAELVYAEFVTPEWRRAWDALGAGLGEIVDASRAAPGKDKTRRLAKAIEESSRALGAMVATRVSDKARAVVRKIEPRARAVRLFQREIEGPEFWQWGGQLRQHVATLRIEPDTPLPKPAKPCPKIEMLAQSTSAKELIAAIRKSRPEETLEERLIHSRDLGRLVLVWQVEDLTAEQFANLRKQAKEELARRQEVRTSSDSPPAPRPNETTVPEWKVVLRPAGADLLAEKGLLRATVVEKVTGDTSPAGLQAGDVIIDYHSVYDLVMGGSVHFAPAGHFFQIARYGGKLDVLRGDQVVTLAVPKRE